jgi:hypothetical protein
LSDPPAEVPLQKLASDGMAIAGIPGREKLRMGLRNSLPRLCLLEWKFEKEKEDEVSTSRQKWTDGYEEDNVSTPRAALGRQTCWYLRPRFLAIILLVITMSTVSEADCWDDSLNQVNRDILVMDSGAVYQVVPSDIINSVFWLPLTNATVCDSLVDVGGRTDDLLPDLQSGYRCIGLGGEGTAICFGNLPRSERFRIVKIA